MKKKYSKVGKLPRVIFGVLFREKSSWQKDNCITHSVGVKDCRRKSTMEAVQGNCYIRCCNCLACKKLAAKLARRN